MRDESLVGEKCETEGRNIDSLVTAVLAEAGVRWRDVSRLVCGVGPGSFTGIRIGLAFSKGLCQSLNIPLSVAPSLVALAAAGAEEGLVRLVAADARREEVFAVMVHGAHTDQPKNPLPSATLFQRYADLACREKVFIWLGERPITPSVPSDFRPGTPDGWTVGLWRQRSVGATGAGEIAALVPLYGRDVNAKTIKQRRQSSR